MKRVSQLPMVCEVLLVNGPGAGRRMDCLAGQRSLVYSAHGGQPATYTLFPFKWDRGTRKSDPGDVYRIGYTGEKPGDDVITAAIKANGFAPYYHWWPERR